MLARLDARTIALLIFGVLAATLAGAWVSQWLGYLPCELCLKQRYAYYLGLPLALAAWFAAPVNARGARFLFALIALAFAAKLGLVIGATPDAALRHEDGFAQAAMRLSAGSDSADLNFVSGTVDIELQRVNEIAGRFALVGFREGNDIEGCFHAFDPEPTTRLETP